MNQRKIAAVTLIALAGFTTQAWSANLTSQTFVTQAGQAGLAEVELSKVALARSSNVNVKALAQQMVDDHSKAGDELRTIALNDKLKVPTTPSVGQQSKVASMRKLKGDKFDRAYAKQLVTDHENAVKLFKEASAADDLQPDLQQFAKKTLTTLEEHQNKSNDLMGAVVQTRDMHGHGEVKGQ